MRERLLEEWKAQAAEFLPVANGEPIWRFSRRPTQADPLQGFKLHVSATVLTANPIFSLCAPYLRSQNILFKSVASLEQLKDLNAGLHYGFSQIGKFITVYLPTTEAALRTAAELDALTSSFAGPRVPFDLPYREGGVVYYRYGAFSDNGFESGDGAGAPTIRDPHGNRLPDTREPGMAVPAWVDNPFPKSPRTRDDTPEGIFIYEVLSRRGKGGVYRAVDLRSSSARRCILKEGHSLGELTWDGRDGRFMTMREGSILRSLRACSIPVPDLLAAFDAGESYYLLLEPIAGGPLVDKCNDQRKRLPLRAALNCARRIAELLAEIHAAGWVWRDCKLSNIILTPGGDVRPVDFEGAARVDEPTALPFGTSPYSPPEVRRAIDDSESRCPDGNLPEDLHALGLCIYHLLASHLPWLDEPLGLGRGNLKNSPLGRIRRRLPREIVELVCSLVDPDPKRRPPASEAASVLSKHID